jgi:hypothetical protein
MSCGAGMVQGHSEVFSLALDCRTALAMTMYRHCEEQSDVAFQLNKK